MKEQSEYMLGAVYILGDRFSGLLKGPDLVCICRLVHVTRIRRAEQAAGPGLVLVWRPAGFSPAVTAVTLVWCYVTHVMCNVRGVTPRLPDRGPPPRLEFNFPVVMWSRLMFIYSFEHFRQIYSIS